MNKLTFREKAGYSCGEFGGSGLWQIMLIFLPIFYTDTFGLSAATTGFLFLVVRIFDAAIDPIMGMIADRTRTAQGHFRPYLLWAAIPFALMGFALFFAPELNPSGKVVYAYVTYVGMMVVYTVTMIPFGALSGVMTADYDERTSLNGYRFTSAFVAALIVQWLVKGSVGFWGHGNDVAGYRWTLGLFGVASVFTFWIAYRSTRERNLDALEVHNSVRDDVRDLLHNRPWLVVLTVSLISLVYLSIRSTGQTYYFKYYVGNDGLVSNFMVAGTLATLVGVLLTSALTRIFDKKPLFMICLVVVGLSSLPMYWLKPQQIGLMFLSQIIYSFACGPVMPLLWSMMGDIANYSEWKNGRRATGLVFSASVMSNKAGGALGGAVAMAILTLYHYQPNVAQ